MAAVSETAKIHDLLYDLTFNEYSIRRHMVNEEEKKKSVNTDTLKYFCDRIGIVGDGGKSNISQSSVGAKAPKKSNLKYQIKK